MRQIVGAIVFAGLCLIAPGADTVLAVHIMAVISWMAGLFYLPRLFVYHARPETSAETATTFQEMERKLLVFIMNPAAIVSILLGLWLAYDRFRFHGVWLWVKLAGVVGLIAVHLYLAGSVKRFASGTNTKNDRHWRLVNEVPTVLMVVIVLMVVLKPF